MRYAATFLTSAPSTARWRRAQHLPDNSTRNPSSKANRTLTKLSIA